MADVSEYQVDKIYHVGEVFTIDGHELTVAQAQSCDGCEFDYDKAFASYCGNMECGSYPHRPSVKVISANDYILLRLKGEICP